MKTWAVLCVAFLTGWPLAALAQNTHTLPLVRPADFAGQESLVRIVNRSATSGTVRITAIDDMGRRFGPVTLTLGALRDTNITSGDLERGNAAKGLPVGVGNGSGSWRLELATALTIEPLAYIRTPDGFLTSMHDEAPVSGGDHWVPFFNPGSNTSKVSHLRIINPGATAAAVTVTGLDDGGNAGSGTVSLTLAAGAARTLSAQDLERGGAGFSGRLGDGAGKWRLNVRSSANIQVMSLLSTRTGHLANLSTTRAAPATAPGGFVVAVGSTSVRPLETITLSLPGGLGTSAYRVHLDLSGAGTFSVADTIEVDGLTTDQNQLLIASPLTQALPDRNTAHRLALRVRRESDRALSNVLRLTIDDVAIPANRAGVPSVLLEVVLEAMYGASDDPLLALGEPSIHPGLMVESAHRLGLDTELADVQANAILREITGLSVATMAAAGPSPSAYGNGALVGENVGCVVASGVCNALRDAMDCIGEGMDRLIAGARSLNVERCATDFKREYVLGWIEAPANWLGWGRTALAVAPKLAGKLISKPALQRLSISVATNKPLADTLKTIRTVSDAAESARDFQRNTAGALRVTKRGLRNTYETLRGIGRSATRESATLIREAEREYTSRARTDTQREAIANLINGQDGMRRDVEAIEALEDVYTGDQDPEEGISNLPDNNGSGIREGDSCDSGYQEFPLDDETSTCVLASLVEPSCYAGSRRVRSPDLGDSGACLYYQLDFFQPGGGCRENYARVQFQGRETCRWSELGANQVAWYTLRKEEGEPPPPVNEHACLTGRWLGVDEETRWQCDLAFPGEGRADYRVEFTSSCAYAVNVRYQEGGGGGDKSWWGTTGIRAGATSRQTDSCDTEPSSYYRFCVYTSEEYNQHGRCYRDPIPWRYVRGGS